MNEESREKIALFRFTIISPILAEPKRAQNQYFREQAKKQHEVPHYGQKSLSLPTMKHWLKLYREDGFEGLKPKRRKDGGRPRKVKGAILDAIRAKCKAFPDWPMTKLHESLAEQNQLGTPPVTYNTFIRVVRTHNLLSDSGRVDIRKRFETDEVNELWVCDFMHGPSVIDRSKRKKAILCAIIDDHSRVIVGHAFSPNETISALTLVLKDAFLTYGIPKRLYVDNGSAFSSDLLLKACAQSGISLIHSKPYDSPSRGKIERFFRTVRERFLVSLDKENLSLKALNDSFQEWLHRDYHRKPHGGIDCHPMDRYLASCGRVDIRKFSRHELDEIFMVRHERSVNNDATIAFNSRVYEVPGAYIRQRIEVRHPVDDDRELYLYDKSIRVAKLNEVDSHENARLFSPTAKKQAVSYSERRALQ